MNPHPLENVCVIRFTAMFVFILNVTNVVAQQNYIPYYQTVAKAEVCVSQRRYDTAMSLYRNALSLVDYPHNKDIRNAYVCAAILNDTNFLFDTLSPYFGRISISALSKLPLFSKYDSLPKWNRAKVLSDSFLLINEQSINWEYVRLIDSICKEDQKPRRGRLPSEIRNKKRRERANSYWHFVDSSVAVTMDSLIMLYGYPCYQNVRYKVFNFESYPVCLWHRLDSAFSVTEYNALCQGKILPEYYARHRTYVLYGLYGNDKDAFEKDIYCTHFMPFPSDSAKMMEINGNRHSIGLPSLQETAAIRKYMDSPDNPGFVFLYSIWGKPLGKK